MAESDAPQDPEPRRDPVSAAVEEFAALASDGADLDVEAFVARWPEADRDELRRRCRETLAIQHTLRRNLHSGRPPRSRDVLAAGSRVGEFTIDHELGRGVLGSVDYLARQESPGRLVTLTVFGAARGTSDELRQRVRRASIAAAQLRHPGIVQILSVGEADGRPFVATECIEGQTLGAVLREDRRVWPGEAAGWWPAGARQPGRLARATEIAVELAEALSYAHEAGIVHRGLHPDRVVLDREGRAHLGAFDLANDAVAAITSGTSGGSGAGDTFAALADDDALPYLSPEQALGRPAVVDGRSDIFSLGVMLYEMLARVRPFTGESPQHLLAAIARGDPVPVRRLDPDVPRDLETVCHRALERRPGRRYANMGELAGDLRRVLGHQAIRARPPSPLVRACRTLARQRTAVVVVALLASAAILSLLLQRWTG